MAGLDSIDDQAALDSLDDDGNKIDAGDQGDDQDDQGAGADDKAGDDDAAGSDDGDKGAGEDDQAKDKEPEPKAPEPKPESKTEPEPKKEEPEPVDNLDAEIDATLKDLAGEWDENTLKTFKTLMSASVKLGEDRAYNRIMKEVAEEEKADTEARTKYQADVDNYLEGWTEEEKQLTEAGRLPKDEKERKAKTDEAFQLMEARSKLAESQHVWSLEAALDILEAKEARANAQKGNDDKKKQQGGMVGGGVNNRPASGKPKAQVGRMSLDDAAEAALSELE